MTTSNEDLSFGVKTYTLIPPDVYVMRLTNVRVTASPGTGDRQLECTFLVDDGDYEGESFTEWVNDKGHGYFSSRSKGYGLLSALLRQDLQTYNENGGEIKTWNDLVGKRCRIVIEKYKNKAGEWRNGAASYMAIESKKQQQEGGHLAKAARAAGGKPIANEGQGHYDPEGEPPLEDDEE